MTAVNPKITNIALNGNGGALKNIPLTIMASKVRVSEDPAQNNGVAQGLQGYIIDTQPPQPTVPVEPGGAAPPQASPANLQVWLPNTAGQNGPGFQPIVFGGSDGRVHGGEGNYVGANGTVILQLQSASPTATGIILEEWP